MRIKNKREYLILYFAMMAVCVCVLGCGPVDKAIVRYQNIHIPAYERSDYEKLLTSEEHEVKYNAICNLIPYASRYASILEQGLSKESSGNNMEDNAITYHNAHQVFEAISTELRSNNESIKAASLMFITEFSSNYSDKRRLFALVSQVNTNDVRTRYEQIRALLTLVDSDTEIDKTLIKKFLNSRSWLIRSMTYRLLGNIVCEEFHPRLLRDYRKATREYDKLLILQAFRQQYGSDVFTLLEEELLFSENPRIHMAVAEVLPGNQDNSAVGTWIIGHYHQLNEEVLTRIIDRYSFELPALTGTTFFGLLLDSNQPQFANLIVHSYFFENLYNGLEKEAYSDALNALRNAVQQNNTVQEAWQEYTRERLKEEETTKREEELRKAILPRYIEMLERFLEESKRLFADSGMTAEEIEDATEEMRELLQIFKAEQAE